MDELTLLLVDWIKEQIEESNHIEAEARDANDPETISAMQHESYAYTRVLCKIKKDFSYLFEIMEAF